MPDPRPLPACPCRAEGLGQSYCGQYNRQLSAHPRMDALLSGRRPDAVFLTSGCSYRAGLLGLYAASKAALEIPARTYAAECATTSVRVNLFAGPHPHTHVCQRFSRDRSTHAADSGGRRQNDRADVLGGMCGERQNLQFSRAQVSRISSTRLSATDRAQD